MTGILVEEEDETGWGEKRVAERGAQRRWRGIQLIFATGVIAGAPSFHRGFIDGVSGRLPTIDAPGWGDVVAVVLAIAVGAYIGWRSWRELDEVERRMTLNICAAVGIVSFVAQALLPGVQPVLHLSDPAKVAWWMSIGAGFCIAVWQKARS